MRIKTKWMLTGLLMVASISFVPLAYGQRLSVKSGERTSSQEMWQQSVDELRLYLNGLLKKNRQLQDENDNLLRELENSGQAIVTQPIRVTAEPCQDAKVQSLKKEIEDLRQENQSLEDRIKIREGDQEGLSVCERAKEDLDNTISELKDKLKSQERDITQLKGKVKYASCSGLESEKSSLSAQLASMKDDLNSQSRKLEDLRKEKSEMLREMEISDSLLRLQADRVTSGSATEGKINHELTAYKLAGSGDYVQAIVEYLEALKYTSDKKDICFNLGILYTKLKDYQRAAGYYKKVISYDPQDAAALLNLSRTYDKLSNRRQSNHYYDLYLKHTKR